jgi:replicative DNA helicase
MPEPAEPTTLDIALDYARRGWRVLPITPGKKHPPITAWQDAATTDHDIITSWFTGLYRNHGIGIATGPGSGLWVLDIDDHDALADLEHANQTLPATLTSLTGSGGQHLIFNYPDDGTEIRNNAGTRLGHGLDVRGEGGQIVAPPTVHPNGNTYHWDAGQPTEPADAPQWLIDLVASPPEPPAKPTNIIVRDITVGDRPGDAWADANDWADILGADGWQLSHTDRKGIRYWVRPGKEVREGHSATTGWSSNDNMNVFTSSLSTWNLHEEHTYSKFGYLSAVHFNEDDGAAAAWLSSQGWGTPRNEVETIERPQPADPVPPETPDWAEPTSPPDNATPDPFPLHTLPTWAQAHAEATADQVQVPVDLTAMLIIGSLSAAATGNANVAISPNWREPVNLYLVTAMRSGSGKSAAEKLCCQWLRDWQNDRMAAIHDDWEFARRVARIAEKKVNEVEKSMSVGSKTEHDLRAATDDLESARAKIPDYPRLIADDATPEAVATLLAAYRERLAIMSTEADLFDMVLKGKTGQRANMNVYLKAWSGDSMIRDRKGGSETGPEATTLNKPLMTVAITVQPSVLARVNGDDEMTSRGFAARFMFSLPEDLIGRRQQSRRFNAAKIATADDYTSTATRLATHWASWGTPVQINVADDAARILEQFLVETEPKLAPGEDLELLGEWINKLHGSIARYAGLLHLAEDNGASTPLNADTMRRAVDLGRYWMSHAIAVLGMVDDPREQSQAILTWAVEDSRTDFTLSDLQKHCRRPAIGLDKVGDYIPAIDQLIDHGWIRPVDNSVDWHGHVGKRSKGNTSPKFTVWPGCIGRPQRARFQSQRAHGSRGSRTDLWESATSLPSSSLPPTNQNPIRYANHANQDPASEPVDNPDTDPPPDYSHVDF